jgi:alpha-N-arabinofuranosidase
VNGIAALIVCALASGADETKHNISGFPKAPAGIAKRVPTVTQAPLVYFDWFEYTGHDTVFDQPSPRGTAPATGNFTWRDEFDSPVLRQQWLYVRTPKLPWVDLNSRPGWLTVHALRVPLESLQNMSFLARRQQHLSFAASTELEVPGSPGVSAGMAAFQNENYWYFLGVRRQPVGGGPHASRIELFLERRAGNQTETLAAAPLNEGAARGGAARDGTSRDDAAGEGAAAVSPARVKLEIVGNGSDYSFFFDQDGSGWKPLKEHADGSILSTDVAGGFVGAMVGPYARAE